MIEKFSWFEKIKLLSSGELDIEGFICLLRKEKIEGFEIELIGRKILNINLESFLKKIKVAILSTNATQPLANAARIACLKEYLFAEVYECPIGAINQELLDSSSFFYQFKPDVVLLDLGIDFFNICKETPMVDEKVKESIKEDIQKIELLWELINKIDAKIIQNTLIGHPYNYSGLAEEQISWGINTYINKLNEMLIELPSKNTTWLDIKKLSNIVGLENWYDLRLFYQSNYGFAVKYLPLYTNWLSACFREIYALKPKLLILDLDNTLWGGVVGDDGLDGIKLGPDSAQGKAYQDFCQYLKSLKNRGVLLAICSKNELANVKEVFENHPHMPLNIDEFSCIKCNWDNKSKNLIEISNELNLSTSSFVFVDDNPAECDLIRKTLDKVRVIELIGDPSKYIKEIDSLNLFNSNSLTYEDLNRQRSYVAKSKFELDKLNFSNLDDYLLSMKMKCSISKITKEQVSRVHQMQMKTNQFNIMTQRFSEEELFNKICTNNFNGFIISLKDKYADHGQISYIEYAIEGEELVIKDWLMSCRVFSRTLEDHIINFISRKASIEGKKIISLNYIQTNKNIILRNIFKKIGFTFEKIENNVETWKINTKKCTKTKKFIN